MTPSRCGMFVATEWKNISCLVGTINSNATLRILGFMIFERTRLMINGLVGLNRGTMWFFLMLGIGNDLNYGIELSEIYK
jgi:hypothetical protein